MDLGFRGRVVRALLVGTGATLPVPERSTPSILVSDWQGNNLLLDAGEGVQLALSMLGVSVSSINLVALTHEHGDHVNGLPGLLQTMAVAGKRSPLVILATRSLASVLKDYFLEDWEAFKVDIVELRGESSLTLRGGGPWEDSLELTWFPVCHTVEAYGFKLRWRLRPRISRDKLSAHGVKPGPWIKKLLSEGFAYVGGKLLTLDEVLDEGGHEVSIVYSGDTSPCNTVLSHARNSRVLIHDSTFSARDRVQARDRGHSTAEEAAEIAASSGSHLLVLTHVSGRYRGWEARALLGEARRIHSRTVLAWDFARIYVSP